TWQTWSQTMDFTSTISWWYWTWYLPEIGPFGVWTLEAEYAGDIIIHEFNYGVYASIGEEPLKLRLYPNPANTSLYITGVTDGTLIKITDVQGKTVFTSVLQNQSIDIMRLTPGLYTI